MYGKKQNNYETLLPADNILYCIFDCINYRHRRGISQKTFAFLIILSLVGCAVSLTLGDYLRNMIRSSGFDVAGSPRIKNHWKRSCSSFQNADDTLNVGVMMFDLNNLKKINDTYGHEQGECLFRPLLLT